MLRNKLEDVLRLIELSRTSQLPKTNGNIETEQPQNNVRIRELYMTENKPSIELTQFDLALDMDKKENRDMKFKCEQLSKQIRSKDAQILRLQKAVEEASMSEVKQDSHEIEPQVDGLDKYHTELEVCAKLVHKLNQDGGHERAELTGLLEEYNQAASKVDTFGTIINQQNKKLNAYATTEKDLLYQLAGCKSKILESESTEKQLRAEKERQSQHIKELLATVDIHTSAMKEERALNYGLSESLSSAQRENVATLRAMQESTSHYTKTVNL